MRLGIVVDTDTRATKQEFSTLRREVKKEADALGGDWEAAAKKVEDALADAGARTDLIDAAKRIGADGPTELEKMQRALKDTGDASKSLSDDIDQAAKDIGASFEDNALTADDVMSAEVGAEVITNAGEVGSEVARGFKDGFDTEDVGTILDGLTDTINSVAMVGGPVAMAAAFAGTSLIQAMMGPFTAGAEEDLARFESRFQTAFDKILEAGERAGRDMIVQEGVLALVQNTEDLNKATEIANALGADRGQVLRALAGDADALRLVEAAGRDVVQEATAAREAAFDAADGSIEKNNELADAEANLTQKQADTSAALKDLTDEYGISSDAVNAATDAVRAKGEADDIATEKALLAAAADVKRSGEAQDLTVMIDGVSEAVRVMPSGKVFKVTDEGTAEQTKEKIGKIKGGTVTMTVKADDSDARATLYNLQQLTPVITATVGAGTRSGRFYQ
jgi:hypothetical protein